MAKKTLATALLLPVAVNLFAAGLVYSVRYTGFDTSYSLSSCKEISAQVEFCLSRTLFFDVSTGFERSDSFFNPNGFVSAGNYRAAKILIGISLRGGSLQAGAAAGPAVVFPDRYANGAILAVRAELSARRVFYSEIFSLGTGVTASITAGPSFVSYGLGICFMGQWGGKR